MDNLLLHAKGLFKERQRIALATLLIIFTFTFYIFYSQNIYGIVTVPPDWVPPGWAQGFEVMYSFNTIGFILALAIMVFMYAFWSWAFLPAPAVYYTLGVIRGIFGSDVEIKQTIGKRFRILLENGKEVYIKCRIKEYGSGEWFVYRLISSRIDAANIEEIALRHGMSVDKGRFISWVGNEELYGRMLLMARAMKIAS